MQVDAPQWPGQASQPVCRALICATTVYRKAKCTTPPPHKQRWCGRVASTAFDTQGPLLEKRNT